MPSIADLFISVSSDVTGAITGLTEVDAKVNGVSASMQSAIPAGLALAGAATAVGGAFGDAIGTAASFEQHISGVKAVMNPEDVAPFGAAIQNLALQLGKDTVFSADQAAGAIEELVKAGVDIPTILNGGAAAALNLAAATGTNVVSAATFAATALNTYHESADQLTHTVDVLTGVSNASAAGMGDLAFAFQAVGPVAAGLGLSFDDTATALGKFADNGLKGSDAGTSLKTMLLNLEPQTKSQVAAFEQLGLFTVNTTDAMNQLALRLSTTADGQKILVQAQKDGTVTLDELFNAASKLNPQLVNNTTSSFAFAKSVGDTSNAFFDASGKAKSMSDIFQVLQTATSNLTNEQKISALQTAFGTDAVRAATIAAAEGAAGFDKLSAQVQIEGLANTEAKTRLDNLNGSLTNLGGSLETARIEVGERFLPVLKQIVDAVNGVVGAFLTLDPQTQTIIVAIVGAAGAIAGLAAGFVLLGPVISAVVAGFGVIAAAVAAAALPIAAIAAAAALLYAAWQDDFGGIREVTQQVLDALQPGFQNILTLIGVIRDNLGPAFSQTQSTLGPFIEQLSQALAPILARLPDLIRLIGDGFNALSPVFQSFVAFLGSLDYTGVVNFFTAIGNAVLLFLNGINQLLNGDFSGAWQSFWNAFTTVLGAVVTAQGEILQTILGAIGNFIQQIPGIIAQNAPGLWQAFLDEVGRLPDQLAPYWQAFLEWFGGLLGQLPGFIADAAGDIWAGLTAAFGALVPQLQPYWDNFAIWFGSVLGGIPQFVIDSMGDVFGGLAAVFGGIVELLAPLWDNFAGWFGAVLGGLPQFVADNAGDVFGFLVQAAENVVGALQTTFGQLADWLASTFGNFWNWLTTGGTGALPAPSGTGGSTGGGVPGVGGTGPLVSVGTLIISSQEEANAFLDLVAQAVLASSRRVSVPTTGGNPVLG